MGATGPTNSQAGLPGAMIRVVHAPDNTLIAREGHGNAKGGHVGEAQKYVTELAEQTPLEGFRQKIGEHVFGLTIPKGDVVCIEAIGNKEIPDVDMTGSLAG